MQSSNVTVILVHCQRNFELSHEHFIQSVSEVAGVDRFADVDSRIGTRLDCGFELSGRLPVANANAV